MPSVTTGRWPLRLLPQDKLVKTGDVDHADWSYRPLVGTVQKLRFRLVRSLLDGQRYKRLLELGYGSGVFMPDLAPGGVYVIVTPGHSPVVDFGLKMLTGASPKDDFADRRQRILPTLLRHFEPVKRIDYPRALVGAVRLYTAMRLVAK